MDAISPLQVVRLEHLAPSPTNPRKTFEDIADLASSIREQGVMQPILARLWPDDYPTPEGRQERPLYEIVAGERRYRASLLAGLTDIPALIRPLSTRQVLEAQIVENLQRRDVTELEEAEGYDLMMREHGYKAEELAEKVGKSKAYIYGRLKLTALCPAAREAYRAGKLNASTALLVARIPVSSLQERATRELIDGHYGGEPMSARQAAAHIQNRYMLRLAEAPFAMDAHLIVKVKGLMGDATVPEIPCTDCPNRTGNNPELYPDVKSADICTDPDCFAAKKAAFAERRVAEAKASGLPVIAGADVEKIAPHGLYNLKGYVKLDDPNYEALRPDRRDPAEATDEDDDEGYRSPYLTFRECLGDVPVQITLIEDRRNNAFVECAKTDALRAALEAAGRPMKPTMEESNRDKSKALKAEAEYRRRLFEAVRAAQRDQQEGTDGHPTEFEIRLVARQFWARLWNESQKKLAALYIRTEDKMPGHERIKLLNEKLDTFSVPELVHFMVECALVGTLDVPPYCDPKTPELLLDAAKHYGLDPAALRKQEKAEKGKSKGTKGAPTPDQAAPARTMPAQPLSIGNRVRIRAGACWDNGEPICGGPEVGTIREVVSDGFSVAFDDGSLRTYLPAHALAQVVLEGGTQKGVPVEPSDPSLTPNPLAQAPAFTAPNAALERAAEPAPTPNPAARAPAEKRARKSAPLAEKSKAKTKEKAAGAARKNEKAKSSGRASASGRKEKTAGDSTDEALPIRCDKTIDMIETNFPELAVAAAHQVGHEVAA